MKTIYNRYGAMCDNKLECDLFYIRKTVESMLAKYEASGYQIREVSYAMQREIACLEAEMVLRKAMSMRKQEKLLARQIAEKKELAAKIKRVLK